MKGMVEKLTLKHRRPEVYNLLKELGCEYIGIEEVPVEKIIIDQGIYPREKTDKERISLYASNILDGDVFPPILTSADYTKLDGNHRYYAHKEAGKSTIWIEKWDVPQGLYPIVAQAVNTEEKATDTPLTIGEKKRAILRDWELLYHYDKKTRRDIIAKTLKVSLSYVNKVLSQAGVLRDEKEELKQKAIELRNQGYTQEKIAKELGVTRRTIADWLKEEEIKDFKSVKNFTQVKNFTSAEENKEEEKIDWDATGWNDYKEDKEKEEYDGSWDDWNDYQQEEKQETSQKKQEKQNQPEFKHPNQILKEMKEALWGIFAQIELKFGTDTAIEILEEIYEAVKSGEYKDLEEYKDQKALFVYLYNKKISGR